MWKKKHVRTMKEVKLINISIFIFYLQVRMQAQRENGGRETFSQAFIKIYKQEGVSGLWRVC